MNTDGSFECICPPGHELTSEGNVCVGEILESCLTTRASSRVTVQETWVLPFQSPVWVGHTPPGRTEVLPGVSLYL